MTHGSLLWSIPYQSADEHRLDVLSEGAWKSEDEVEEHADDVDRLSTDHLGYCSTFLSVLSHVLEAQLLTWSE